MKNLNLAVLVSITLAAFFIGTVPYPGSDINIESDLADFKITIQKNESGLKLACIKGCAWKTLSYYDSNPNHSQTINEFGMVTNYNSHNSQKDLANFKITTHATESGVELTCLKGCAWKTLSYYHSNSNQPQTIDEYGIVSNSRK